MVKHTLLATKYSSHNYWVYDTTNFGKKDKHAFKINVSITIT